MLLKHQTGILGALWSTAKSGIIGLSYRSLCYPIILQLRDSKSSKYGKWLLVTQRNQDMMHRLTKMTVALQVVSKRRETPTNQSHKFLFRMLIMIISQSTVKCTMHSSQIIILKAEL